MKAYRPRQIEYLAAVDSPHASAVRIIGELEELLALMRDMLPDPASISGWDDDDAPEPVCLELAALARCRGIPEDQWPEHVRGAMRRQNE